MWAVSNPSRQKRENNLKKKKTITYEGLPEKRNQVCDFCVLYHEVAARFAVWISPFRGIVRYDFEKSTSDHANF